MPPFDDSGHWVAPHDSRGRTPEGVARDNLIEAIKRQRQPAEALALVRKASNASWTAVYDRQGNFTAQIAQTADLQAVDASTVTYDAAGNPVAVKDSRGKTIDLVTPSSAKAKPSPAHAAPTLPVAGGQPDATPASLAAATPVAKASGSEAEFRRLGAQRVRKGLVIDPRTTDTLLLGAIERVRMTPTARRRFDDGLKARYSLADRTRTVNKLRQAIRAAKAIGWTLPPVSSRAQELRVTAARRGTTRG